MKADDIRALATWTPRRGEKEISFMPARVLLQDFTGVPVRRRSGGDARRHRRSSAAIPTKVNPLQPVELVIDHSVQVDHFGTAERARS